MRTWEMRSGSGTGLYGLSARNKGCEEFSNFSEEGEQLAARAAFDSRKSSEPVFRFCGFFLADRYLVNEVIVRLCANSLAIVCSDRCRFWIVGIRERSVISDFGTLPINSIKARANLFVQSLSWPCILSIRNRRFHDPHFDLPFPQITSAKERSVRRKYQIPLTISTATTPMDRAKPGQYIACSPPRIDQRKPSMMPTIGLSE